MRSLPGVVLAAALTAAPAIAQHHDHGHAHAAPAAAQADASTAEQRFATDEPLRRNMARIRSAVDALGHAEHGHLDAGQVAELAGGISASVRDIIAECRLPPDADAVLHGIIAPLMQQARALEANPTDTATVAPMRAALAEYARLFDDPAVAND